MSSKVKDLNVNWMIIYDFVYAPWVSLDMRYLIFVDFYGEFWLTCWVFVDLFGFLSTVLYFLHCFVADSGIIMNKEFINYYLRCPTYDLIILFNSHPSSNIPIPGLKYMHPRLKYYHRGLNIPTRFKYFHPEVEIFTPRFKYLHPGSNIWTGVEIFKPRWEYMNRGKKYFHLGWSIWYKLYKLPSFIDVYLSSVDKHPNRSTKIHLKSRQKAYTA